MLDQCISLMHTFRVNRQVDSNTIEIVQSHRHVLNTLHLHERIRGVFRKSLST